ncbi:MerR family transcriptional regulator [Actinoplanes sp. SE50]|uniref:MerR family transcriptional regulator n=1 Tax=unclassified Actinoplanes TaxID=2626549 RepID=UPI00023ED1F2|nr:MULTISPECIES: MerR family transcriptional regulator [unclassified Actinoplanes]AEV83318.1 HTH-type transcriptional activator tipA [Actinoplanes sp. SE50/110]ATO81711.1 MerR family transcriptional regulator [Actinoplanes sp. SE50]SLL99119.1 MarR family transcriptional regulator [Actinoplanes sp. SE50/110]
MNGDMLLSIGDLARRTGLTVKTVRFYSDLGVVAPATRSPAGYRRYAADAVARLDLVRTLRELGIDLATIRTVVDRQSTLPEVAAAHADALQAQIRVLRIRRAVLTVAARRGAGPAQLEVIHQLARLSAGERRELIDDFLGAVFAGLHEHPALPAVARSMTPDLPADPEPEQIEAWVELAGLFQDDDFRATLHGMAREMAGDRAADDRTGLPRVLADAIRAQVAPALRAGIDPGSPTAEPTIAALVGHYAHITGHPDDAALRRRFETLLRGMNDPRRDRYLSLLAVVNGRPVPDSLAPMLDWAVAALRARTAR